MRPAGCLAGDLGTLVPAQPEPVQPVEDVLLVGDRRASDVGVLEAEDERAAGVPGVEVVEQRRPCRPDVERTRRARGDADAVRRSFAGDAVEERRVCLAAKNVDERRGPESEGRAATRPVERQRVERFRAGEDRYMGARRQGPRLEVRQEARVLLGLLGDPVDRGLLAGLDLAERRPGRAAACRLGIDRVAMRARLRVAEHLVEARLDPWRDRALEACRLLVRLGPAEADDRGQQPFEQRVAAEDRVSGGSAGPGQDQLATVRLVDEAVRAEPAEHLARGLGRDAHPARHLGRLDVGAVTGHHPQGQEVFLGRR